MDRVIVDCANPAVQQRRAFTPDEQSEYDARQLLPVPAVGMTSVAGKVNLSTLDGLTKTVTFPQALRSADYVVTFTPLFALSASVWSTEKTVRGFTLNLSLAVNGVIEYIAHEVTT